MKLGIALMIALSACGSKSPTARRSTAPFVREGDHWVQRHPRLPDDGEWTCDDMGGAAVCWGGDAPAGVAVNVADRAWTCGNRGHSKRPTEDGERVCVDPFPDVPDGDSRHWQCRYAHEPALQRICERGSHEHAIGDFCDHAHPCYDGLSCSEARCAPERVQPRCVIDRDCDRGACRFGTCFEVDR